MAQPAMRPPYGFVLLSQALDQHCGFLKRVEDLPVQELIPQLVRVWFLGDPKPSNDYLCVVVGRTGIGHARLGAPSVQ